MLASCEKPTLLSWGCMELSEPRFESALPFEYMTACRSTLHFGSKLLALKTLLFVRTCLMLGKCVNWPILPTARISKCSACISAAFLSCLVFWRRTCFRCSSKQSHLSPSQMRGCSKRYSKTWSGLWGLPHFLATTGFWGSWQWRIEMARKSQWTRTFWAWTRSGFSCYRIHKDTVWTLTVVWSWMKETRCTKSSAVFFHSF